MEQDKLIELIKKLEDNSITEEEKLTLLRFVKDSAASLRKLIADTKSDIEK